MIANSLNFCERFGVTQSCLCLHRVLCRCLSLGLVTFIGGRFDVCLVGIVTRLAATAATAVGCVVVTARRGVARVRHLEGARSGEIVTRTWGHGEWMERGFGGLAGRI